MIGFDQWSETINIVYVRHGLNEGPEPKASMPPVLSPQAITGGGPE